MPTTHISHSRNSPTKDNENCYYLLLKGCVEKNYTKQSCADPKDFGIESETKFVINLSVMRP